MLARLLSAGRYIRVRGIDLRYVRHVILECANSLIYVPLPRVNALFMLVTCLD